MWTVLIFLAFEKSGVIGFQSSGLGVSLHCPRPFHGGIDSIHSAHVYDSSILPYDNSVLYNALPYFTYPITIDKLDNGENSLHVDHFLKSWLFHAFFHPDVTCRAKAYLLTFLACLAFGVRQLRIFQKVDMQNSTHKAALSRAGLVMAWCCAAKIRVFFFEG